jgi:hypothetical protein
MQRQIHGIIVSLPKSNGHKTPDGYRPITLMKNDYKILARIMAQRLIPALEEQLTSGPYCAVPGKSILEALPVLRDVIAHAEVTLTPRMRPLPDFRHVLDRISHHYIFQILQW